MQLRRILRGAEAKKALMLMHVIGGKARFRILTLLRARPKGLSSGDIALALSASPSNVSHQLKILKRYGLIRSRRRGRETIHVRRDHQLERLFPR